MAGRGSSKPPSGNSAQPKEPSKEIASQKPQQPTEARDEAIAVLTELGAAIEKASNYSSIYADFGKILDQKSDLELQISDKTGDIATKQSRIAYLEAHNQQNIDDFEKRYADWAEEREALQQRVKSAKTEAAERSKTELKDYENRHKKEVGKLGRELAAEKSKSESLHLKLDASKSNETRLQRQLDLADATSSEWEGKISMLKDLDIVELLVRSDTGVIYKRSLCWHGR